jgi:hypothetical protein
VAFEKSMSGFPTDRIPKTIAAGVTPKMLVLRIHDEITALPHPISGCSGSSACSERKRGKPSFLAIGDASAYG